METEMKVRAVIDMRHGHVIEPPVFFGDDGSYQIYDPSLNNIQIRNGLIRI
jgi:hypothetical protein